MYLSARRVERRIRKDQDGLAEENTTGIIFLFKLVSSDVGAGAELPELGLHRHGARHVADDVAAEGPLSDLPALPPFSSRHFQRSKLTGELDWQTLKC